MKLKSCHTTLLTVVFCTLMMPVCAFSQEDRAIFDAEITPKEPVRQDHDSPSGSENPEIRTNKNPTATTSSEPAVSRDSETKPVKPLVKSGEKQQKEEEKAQKEEEDPLSFNFLYYIIEKFKLSDIVE